MAIPATRALAALRVPTRPGARRTSVPRYRGETPLASEASLAPGAHKRPRGRPETANLAPGETNRVVAWRFSRLESGICLRSKIRDPSERFDALVAGHVLRTQVLLRAQRIRLSGSSHAAIGGMASPSGRLDRLEGYRSSGRRPTTHHATGNNTAARTSFRTSPSRNGVSPSAIVSSGFDDVTTPSHGRPIA